MFFSLIIILVAMLFTIKVRNEKEKDNLPTVEKKIELSDKKIEIKYYLPEH